MKLLIGNPRCGSTFAHRYFQEYNRLRQPCEVLPELWCEYLSPKLFPEPIEKKIQYIENLRRDGKELLFQLHAKHLREPYKDGTIADWYFDFYKDAEFFIIKRRNMWDTYMSLLIHFYRNRLSTSWLNPWHNDSDMAVVNMDKYLIDVQFKHSEEFMDIFFDQWLYLNSLEGNTLYLEDFSHESMNEMLGVEIEEVIKPWGIDYESLIHPKELEIMKKSFNIKVSRNEIDHEVI